MKLTVLLFFWLFLFVLVSGCSKSDSKPNPAPQVPPHDSTTGKTDTTVDVYVVGNLGKSIGYWKNSQFITLGTSATYAYGIDMAFSGNDIYVAGKTGDSTGYWKNDQFHLVTKGDTLTPESIALSGADVYSFLQVYPGSWNGYLYKNNALSLALPTVNQPSATEMTLSGSDLYIPGTVGIVNKNALYWKNGIADSLPTSLNGSYAYSIFVDGTDVYAAGRTFSYKGISLATYWKNGVPVYLTDSSISATANYITVSNGNVYIAGTVVQGDPLQASDNLHAVVWKNGVATNLTQAGWGDRVLGFAVNGSDVYVSVISNILGSQDHQYRYYKNSTIVNYMSPGTGYGTRIFVRPR